MPKITILPKSISDKYALQNNALIQDVKTDWKDKISAEIGDTKDATTFHPQVKIQRWDNEVNFSLRLKHTEKNHTVEFDGEKIKWKGAKVEAHFYDKPEASEDGGHEFEVILKEKPKTNIIEFSLNTKGVDFFYQPALTQQEIDEGAIRPENVVGSYAVYASEQKANWKGGKEYKVGKVGHIYRPKIYDATGKECWGSLSVDKEAGKLSVEIPQEFLDKAVYPVVVDPTFGYTTVGATSDYPGTSYVVSSLFTSPIDMGEVTIITAYVAYASSGYYHFKGLLINHGDLTIAANGVTNESPHAPSTAFAWIAATFASNPTLSSSTEYLVGSINSGSGLAYKYDDGAANQANIDTTNNYTTPANLGSVLHYDRVYSIYATYTAGGGETSRRIIITQ